MLKRTPLFNIQSRLGGKFGPFGKWEMPLWFPEGIKKEVMAVRQRAGIFDVSHMGEFLISGKGSLDFLQNLLTNDLSKVELNKAQYNLMLNPSGGVIDDLIVYRVGLDEWRLVVNASNVKEDKDWICKNLASDVTFRDESDDWGLIAIQGPESEGILGNFCSDISKLKRFELRKTEINEVKVEIARTGYTGEDGFEIFVRPMEASVLYEQFADMGVSPIGLGARDALRLEVCYPLHGHEISPDINPLEAGLGWAVKLEKGDFIGRDNLLSYEEKNPKREIVALFPEVPVREGAEVYLKDSLVGKITSGLFSPTLEKPIALALLENFDKKNKDLVIKKGKRFKIAKLCEKPFYRR